MVIPSTLEVPSFFAPPRLCEPLPLLLIKFNVAHQRIILLLRSHLSLLNLCVQQSLLFLEGLVDFLVDFVMLLCVPVLFPLLEGRHLLYVLVCPLPLFVLLLCPVVQLLLLLGFDHGKLLCFLLLLRPEVPFLLLKHLLSLPLLLFDLHLLFCL